MIKKLTVTILIACMLVSILPFKVSALNYDGYEYTIESTGTVTITGYTGSETDLTIPSIIDGRTVKEILFQAFENKWRLTSVTLPDSITHIYWNAFNGCSGLTSVKLPSNLEHIGDSAFEWCTSLKSIALPSGLETIGYRGFAVSGLTGITIPEGVVSIGESAFVFCEDLLTITIPSSVTSIGGSIATYCSSLTAINVAPGNANYASVSGILYNKSKTTLLECPGALSGPITIPEGITSIANNTFSNVVGITSVSFPSTLTSIGASAFEGCDGLTGNITLPDNLTYIGSDAFHWCEGMGSITIPSKVSFIGDEAFQSCYSMTAINVSAANPDFASESGILYNKSKTTLISCPAGKTGTVIIPDGVMDIKEEAFYNILGLTGVTIPNTLMSIGKMAFHSTGLTSVTIPDSVTSIEDSAFELCTNLSNSYFYGNAPTMGTSVFNNCASGFTVYYLSTNTSFTNPWHNYTALPFTPTTPTPTVTPTTTPTPTTNPTPTTTPTPTTSPTPTTTPVPTTSPIPTTNPNPDTHTVSYRTHVQDVGWQGYVSNGAASGTSGQSKRLEAINIRLEGISGGIEYQTHVQDIGWQNWVANDALSGTSGQSKRLEAIRIRLTDEAATKYDVYYRVHAQNVGWMGWAKNGESSGTAGHSYRLEAIEIKLVAKGGSAPGATAWRFIDKYEPVNAVNYRTHVQDVGWQPYVRNGMTAGTSGQSKRLEGIQIKLNNIKGGIEYRTHVQDYGWMDWVGNDAMSGTSGQSKRLEAIQIRLTGVAADTYDIYYCVHAENTGWLDWAKNGESAGTAGFGYRLEAIQIVLVPKGGPAPGMTARAFVQG